MACATQPLRRPYFGIRFEGDPAESTGVRCLREIAFYRDVLGFGLTQRYGGQAAFLSAGRVSPSHRIEHVGKRGRFAAATRHDRPVSLAILYPTRAELAEALRRLIGAGIPLEGASDHGVSEALYLRDPDGNGVELYWDRAPEQWPRTLDGELNMGTEPLDLEALLAEA